MLAKMYHAVIPRQRVAGLCWTAIPSTPRSILPPPFVEDGPPPTPTEGGLPGSTGSTVGPAPEAGVMQGRLEGVCLGALHGEFGLKSSTQCSRSATPTPPKQQNKCKVCTEEKGKERGRLPQQQMADRDGPVKCPMPEETKHPQPATFQRTIFPLSL